jgi:ubiquinone/menaquinone biosynthesis C-methylase UbiE
MSVERTDNPQRHFLPAASHDLFLPLYDPVMSLMGADHAQNELIDLAKIAPTHRVLDLGCGTGTLLVRLKRRHSTLQIFGLDPDRKVLRRAHQKARRAGVLVHFDQGFSDALPYKGASFDRVISSFMFHHLQEGDREKTLQEVARVLKPGGSFHLLDFTASEQGSPGLCGRLLESHAQLKHNTNARLLHLMRLAGFSGEEKVKDGRMFFGLLRTTYYRATV